MIVISEILFWSGAFIIFWAMIGYPISLMLIEKYININDEVKNYDNKPSVTIMVVAHNEEKVILEKLKNIIELEYPKDRISFLIASDNSTDKTNEIVSFFIEQHPQINIRLHQAKERMGKTSAQNEAQKLVETEMLVMTDANSILDRRSILELMASFSAEDIAYVTGKLVITNSELSNVSESESEYWNLDIAMRGIESRIQTITAGNGALYAVRNKDYIDFKPIESHDSSMPLYYGLLKKRAIMNSKALVFEKAGETHEDEFQRKVRMNRLILAHVLPSIKLLNVFQYKWFTYFYLGHRTCRYLLWISHAVLFITNLFLLKISILYNITLLFQVIFYSLSIILQNKNLFFRMGYYYIITILAQWVGVVNILTGKSKPFWEKAESTR